MDFKGQLASALVLNVVLKLITFSLSTLLTRQLEPSENGVSFSFLLYYNTVLYLARECVRSVNARYNLVDKAENGTVVLQVINCAFISVPLGILVMIALELISYSGIYVFPSLSALSRVSGVSSIPSTVIANHDETIGIIGIPELFLALSVIITLMIEPCITLLRSFDYFRFIVASEFWALMVRLVVTLIFVRIFGDYFSSDPWIVRMCFATGNFAYALTTVGYFLWLWNSNDCKGSQDRVPLLHQARANAALKISGGVKDHVSISISNWRIFLPWGFLSWSIFYASLMREWSLMFQFFRESTLRLVLAEGERFALVAFGSAAVMGRYDFVASLGSLVARVVFSVWEGACFTKWSRDAACGKGREAVALLLLMLRVSFYFGAAAVLVGPPLAESFLTFAFTRRWATVATVRALQLYTCVLLLLGWNGLLDAFVRATAAARTLQRVQATLLFHAALYVIACFLLLRPTASVDPHSPTERMEENNSNNNNNNNSNGDPVVGLLCITAASMALRCVVSLCVLHRSSLQTRVTLWDLRAAFNFRVTAVWALLFLFTRCLHAATAILAGPLFGAAILAWDPEIRGMLLAVVRR
ncbi:putative dolichyl-P-Man:GDP-Man5GlcNAc2-PP-dolichyl alpha-1,2-mannosyltranslocase [Trypanosoma theileri]|uniref:Protein RFT1 homolog n=1 Tax=Trypanosoma theileri TaxID=67003 RepID=A0A1X0NQN5_9TRYP|nr:putative dolichyl-P-Man:GDP-Man5GlcNAc2-PP-dolichyl alpha-1,2-mannosyltranslocase [Trypanosoma theileri]ORC87022.1 putative dolichyl-P-Man:GDP-Man5GlcNAc2-PP-dolichyl alpha-1,2-mannosyltranslocase [Trypanosoma theileri]